MGRFWGSFVTLVFISAGAMLGIYLGSIIVPATGWTDAARYGPNVLINYLHPWLTLVIPNLWMSGCLFFALIIFTRNIKSIYSGGIVIFIGYLLANFFSQDIENKNLVQLLDPFALNSFDLQVRYLTPFEQNNSLVDVSGMLLLNRILWVMVGLLFFAAAYFRFSFAYFFRTSTGKVKKETTGPALLHEAGRRILSNFSGKYQWESFKALSKVEVQNITKDVYFRSILLGGIILLVVDFWIGNTYFGVSSLPATHLLMEYKGFDYSTFVFIILVFFTGEALHRDRSTGFALITDTFPVKDGVVIASKFMGMVAVCLILTTIPIVVGIIVQTLKGYFNYDLKVYLIDSYLIALPDYLQMVMLVFAIHLVANSKFAGHAVSVGVWLVLIVLRNFANFDFNLFLYTYKPEFKWSAMNGLGHFAEPLLWFNLYWSWVGIFLILFFSISYSRGVENSFTSRLKRAKSKLNSRTSFIAYAFLVVAIASGAYIFNSVVYV
nr:hypothetical protein [Bacteroidota bacterium]